MEGQKVEISYEALWKVIIRPPRDDYTPDKLGSETMSFNHKKYHRHDFDILSTQGYILKASFIEPEEDYRPYDEMPVVIYLHGNSSSRLEGLKMATELLKRDVNLFLYDSAGCGMSEGEYISLGYHEKEDLKLIVDFIEKRPGVGPIGLWGRSMGAATSMLYAYSDDRIYAACLDSPFCDFNRLAKELCLQQVNLPNFVLETALSVIRGTIKNKNGLDIRKLRPIDAAEKTKTPMFFIHAMNDELIKIDHSIDLTKKHLGEKEVRYLEVGSHNSVRPKQIILDAVNFLCKYLKPDTGPESEIINNIDDTVIDPKLK